MKINLFSLLVLNVNKIISIQTYDSIDAIISTFKTVTDVCHGIIMSDLIAKKRVRFQDIPSQEVDAFIIIPANFDTSQQDLFSAFSTNSSRSLRRFELVLTFLSKLSRGKKIKEILDVVRGIQVNPELRRRTIILTPSYVFVRTKFR